MRLVSILAAIALTLTVVSGCEDGDFRQREEIQHSLTEAGKELQKATAAGFVPGSDEFNAARSSLDRVIKTLNGINPDDEGQKAAKSLMTASALREAAIMDYARASEIEAKQQANREVVLSQIDAITSMAAIADGQQKIDATPDTQNLEKERQAALQRIDELTQRIEQLSGPISERTSANDTAKKEVERLKTEVNDLRRKASELGNADGFVTYQQAIETRRQADKIEYDISQREMELGYNLEPDNELAGNETTQLKSRIENLQSTNRELDAFSKATADSIAATRKQMSELSAQVTESLKKVAETTSTELTPLYEQAEAALQKAASMAGAGGSGSAEDMSSARLLKARVLELQGKFSTLQARSLSEQKAILEKLSQAGNAIPSSGDIKAELDAAGAALTAALEKAKASFSEAMDAASQVKSNSEAIELFRKNLENAVEVLSGQKPAAAPKPSSGDATSETGAPTAANGSPGSFATAKDLVSYLNSLPNDMSGVRAGLAVMHAQTAQGRKYIQFNTQMSEALNALDSAMTAKFNTGLFQALGPQGQALLDGMRTDLSTAKPTEESEDQVVYAVNMGGQTIPITLRLVDGSWWVDMDSQAQHMARTMPMLTQAGDAMVAGYNDIAKRVTAGEFATAQEAVMAFGQAMQKAMSGVRAPAGGTENP